MSHNILVTGNGFDLYHGLKTNYTDFIAAVAEAFRKKPDERDEFETALTTLCQHNGFFNYFLYAATTDCSWSHFEEVMQSIIDVFITFFTKMTEEQKDTMFDATRYKFCYEESSYFELRMYKQFFLIYEMIYDDMSGGMLTLRQNMVTEGRRVNEKAILDELKKELADFTQALNLYLTAQNERTPAALSPQIAAIRADYVINFNFTDTFKSYGIDTEQVFFAKGKAGSDPCNMVLGIPDETEDHMDFIYFKNYFQTLAKFTGIYDRSQLTPKDDEGNPIPVTTHLFGYSFPLGDAPTIQALEAASETVIVYYTDSEDYAHKIIQLLKILGKGAAMEKIQTGKIRFEQVQ